MIGASFGPPLVPSPDLIEGAERQVNGALGGVGLGAYKTNSSRAARHLGSRGHLD